MRRCVAFTIGRLKAFLDQVDRIAESDFTYSDAPNAVALIRKRLEHHLSVIETLYTVRSTDLIAARCDAALSEMSNLLPFLGIILRSTHIRNAFEIYGPIRHLAKALNDTTPGRRTRVIWSSGWDLTPTTYRESSVLPGYILITIPATESSNPLVIPLAGHELGHRVWANEAIEEEVSVQIEDSIVEYIRVHYRSLEGAPDMQNCSVQKVRQLVKDRHFEAGFNRAVHWAIRQSEEIFCDLVGFYLFGESFLNAFAYLLSPGPPRKRNPSYPRTKTRAQILIDALAAYQNISPAYTCPTSYDCVALFQDAHPQDETDFWVDAADHAGPSVSDRLIGRIVDFSRRPNWIAARTFSNPDRSIIKDKYFRWGVPASNAGSLTNILNAAWDIQLDSDFWSDLPALLARPENEREEYKRDLLREMVLKNIEVFEYELITQSDHDT